MPKNPQRLYALHCGGDVCDWSVFDPFDSRVGQSLYNPYFAYVYQHPSATVLIDCGADPALAESSELVAGLDLRVDPADRIDAKLATIGLTPDSIDLVIQSHLHYDHAGGLPWLPGATVMLQRAEHEFAHDPPVYQRDLYRAEEFAGVTEWSLLDGEHDVFGDESLVTIPTPGHTAGHQSVLVNLPEQPVLLLCDATYVLEKLRDRRLPAIVWSPDRMVESWEGLERIERERGALLLPAHEPSFRDFVRMAPDQWYG